MFRFCRKSSLKLLFLPKNGREKPLRQSEKQPLRATRVTVKYLPTTLNRRLKSVREKQATMQFRLPTLMTDIFLYQKSAYRNSVRTFCYMKIICICSTRVYHIFILIWLMLITFCSSSFCCEAVSLFDVLTKTVPITVCVPFAKIVPS